MPEGKDPDDLLRAEGAAGLQKRLDAALPMVRLLWQRETEARDFDSPERRAALDKALRDKIALIRDPSIRHHYGQAVKELRWQLFNPRPAPGKGGKRGWQNRPEPVRAETRTSLLVAAGEGAQAELREAVILATLIRTPAVLDEFEGQIEDLPCAAPDHARLRDLLLRHAGAGAESLAAHIGAELGEGAIEKLCARPHVALAPAVRRAGDEELARQTVQEELAKLAAERGLRQEISEASQDIDGMADEVVTHRLKEAAQAHESATRSLQEDKMEYELGENGAQISRSEKDAFAALLETIAFSKGDSK